METSNKSSRLKSGGKKTNFRSPFLVISVKLSVAPSAWQHSESWFSLAGRFTRYCVFKVF